MEGEIENAINIAYAPTSSQELRGQAIQFLNQVQQDGSAWQACLGLFVREPRPADIVRHTSLDVVNNAIQIHQLDEQSLAYIKDTLMNYVRQACQPGNTNQDSSHMQNKLMQTMTVLFAATYPSSWQSFFDDFRAIAGDQAAIATVNETGTILYLRMLNQVNDEIADQLLARSGQEQKRNTELKDLIRQRDAQKISLSWQEILAKWREADLDLIESCVRTISRWVSWIDISLVVNQTIINVFLELAGQQDISNPESAQGKVRDAAIDAFSEIVAKKMSPTDKIQLILFLDLPNVVGQFVESSALKDLRNSPDYDNDLAETVAKLVNNIVFDIVRILDTESVDPQIRQRADSLLQQFIPYLLRFFSDQYDEVCSNVIPSLTDMLTFFRKLQKKAGSLPQQYTVMLPSILDAIIGKMKYDDTADWGDEGEQTDEAEFQDLRKRLHVLQQSVAAIDESFYIQTLSRVVSDIFGRLSSNDQSLNWRDLDLALLEMYYFGELTVPNQGLYAKRVPSSVAASRLIAMMSSMLESGKFPERPYASMEKDLTGTGLASYQHPAIQLQYMEICVRYCQFFEQNSQYIPKALENFVHLTHSNHPRVRGRSWYLFQRFVKTLRAQLGNVSQNIIEAVADLLPIRAELPDESSEDMSSDEDDQSADALFNSQLYLFEAIGCIASSATVPTEKKRLYVETILNPLFVDLEGTLPQARNGNERAILQIHHVIMAIATLALGYCNTNTSKSKAQPVTEISDVFHKASEAVLVALSALNSSQQIRTAARSAFSRMIAVLGPRILEQLQRWTEGLLSPASSTDEISTFLKVLGQVVFAFKTEISTFLDNLITPLLQQVFNALAIPPAGTDDVIQLVELRREYLAFVNNLLQHGLGSVLISNANQPTFESIVTSLDTFARDTKDYPTARLAISVIIRMISVWGGPDKIGAAANNNPTSPVTASETIPGFDSFVLDRFAPLVWSVPGTQDFNPKDAQAKQVLFELAMLQAEIVKKIGQPYVERLQGELVSGGAGEDGAQQYLRSLAAAIEDPKKEKEWKSLYAQFVERLLAARG